MLIKHIFKFTDDSGAAASITVFEDGSFLCPICGVRFWAAQGPSWTTTGEPMSNLCPVCGNTSGRDDIVSGFTLSSAWNRLRIEWLNGLSWHPYAIVCQERFGFSIENLRELQAEYVRDRHWRERPFKQRLARGFMTEVVPVNWKSGNADTVPLWKPMR